MAAVALSEERRMEIEWTHNSLPEDFLHLPHCRRLLQHTTACRAGQCSVWVDEKWKVLIVDHRLLVVPKKKLLAHLSQNRLVVRFLFWIPVNLSLSYFTSLKIVTKSIPGRFHDGLENRVWVVSKRQINGYATVVKLDLMLVRDGERLEVGNGQASRCRLNSLWMLLYSYERTRDILFVSNVRNWSKNYIFLFIQFNLRRREWREQAN